MFEHQSKCKAMAMALVAMLAFCSVSVMLTDTDATGNNGETYTIYLRVNDTFAYKPQVNLTEDVTISIDQTSDVGMSECYDTGTGVFTFKPQDTTPKTVKFVATWIKGTLTQKATQTIVFQVYENLALSNGGSSIPSIIRGDSEIGTQIYKPIVESGHPDYTYTPTIPDELKDYVSWNGTAFVTKAALGTSVINKSYTLGLTVTDNGIEATDNKTNRLDAQTVEVGINLTISDRYAIEVENYYETFAGELGEGEERLESFPVDTNSSSFGDITSETITATAYGSDNNPVDGLVSYNPSDKTVRIDLTKAVFASDETEKTFTVRINANATSTGLGALSDTANVTLKIYADLEFISEPTISNSGTSLVGNNTMDMFLTATFDNATKVTYYWGDGTMTTLKTDGSDSSTFSTRHVYDSEGVYFITVYADNDKGTSKLITMYNAYDGTSETVDAEPEQTFFEEHGYQFIVFALISAIAFAAFFLFGFQSRPVIIIALVCATLAVLTYLYCDISGLVDALKGLF